MAEHPMETTLRTALWRQFGAAIDMLENALLACPSTLWNTHLWSDHSDPPQPSEFATFWSLTHHALFWLDLYLTGSLEGFAPPTPSSQDFVQAVTRTGGIQAQVMSAAELAVCTRVEGLSPHDVQSALWQDHTLVKTWAMRSTLHLLSARELPLYVAARDWQHNASWSNYFAEFGLSR